MPRDVVERSIAVPPPRVWPFLADFAQWPRWWVPWPMAGELVEAEGEAEEGARRRGRLSGGARMEELVTVAAPPALLALAGKPEGSPVREYTSTIALAPTLDGGTRVRWEHTYRLRGLHRLLAPAHRARLRATKAQSLDALGRLATRRH